MQLIGSYRIVDVLGQGGMGIVYRARRLGSERVVALKTVRVPTSHWLAGIRREVQALSRIRHPGIVRMLDHGVHEGLPWYAMDLLEGETLRHYSRRIWSPYLRCSAPPPSPYPNSATEELSANSSHSAVDSGLPVGMPEQGRIQPAAAGELGAVLRIFHRLCGTLSFLHGEGIVNCDLKPENVLLVDGQPVLIDFGLTVHSPRAGRELLESCRMFAGTVPYMSPEQILGEFVDARSDLYSVGCMLYELVTGLPPFTGNAVAAKHLREPVRPPTELVSGIPHKLERTILKLVEKALDRRFGFADEVAADLAELAETDRVVRDYPPSAPYLYRPRFVGREHAMAVFEQARERLLEGAGALFILGGESGAGKTRLAMETTRAVPSRPTRVITSEVSTVAIERRGFGAAAPFCILLPLLEAIADQCQEGGPEVTERLLGPARFVLAPYEPRLAQIPARASAPPPIPISAEASRKRLFQAAASVLAAYSRELPLLWVIDDLGWADELSLAFLLSLDAEYFDRTAVLILCTYRTEESRAEVERLTKLPHVRCHRLEHLEQAAVRSMVSDMLALPDPANSLVEFVTHEAEGNPFFVSEYLRAAVGAQVLYRDSDHTWRLASEASSTRSVLESLGLPGTLRELIEQRFRYLSPAAREICLVASVLGREADAEVLRSVARLSEDVALDAIDELLRRDMFMQPEPERVRFVHDKLHEIAYQQLDAGRRVVLHGRAALALEDRFRGQPGEWRVWPALGHHFAAAQQHEAAARYLQMAADHARTTHANHGAIQLYREAVEQLSQHIAEATSSPALEQQLAEMHEALGDVLTLTGQRELARVDYDWTLQQCSPGTSAVRARVLRKLGKTWEIEHKHEEALRYYAAARDAAGMDSNPGNLELRHEWIQAHIEELWVYYWLARVQDMDRLVRSLEPHVGAFGSHLQHARFYQVLVLAGLRRNRYVIDEVMLRHARAAVDAAQDPSAQVELPMSQFLCAFALLLNGSGTAGDVEMERARTLAEQAGDAGLLTRCLTYLTMSARLLGNLDQARVRADSSLRVATAAGLKEYIAAAFANQAWVCYREGARERAQDLARQAMTMWSSLSLVFPFQNLALIPLLQLALEDNELARAVECATALLGPDQWVLSGAATDALARACTAWKRQDPPGAQRELEQASRHLRFL